MLNLFQHPLVNRLGPDKRNQKYKVTVTRNADSHLTMEKEPCVYILASQTRGTLYIGVTSNLLQRMWQHRNGATEGFASRYKVYRLVRFEMFATMAEAIAREKQLKNWHRQWKINLIESENPHWIDLAVSLGFDPLPPKGASSNVH